tara:strand:+ start:6483 stop:7952 length:1470 start_codon:yes stop_codon:yes gene_type:complete
MSLKKATAIVSLSNLLNTLSNLILSVGLAYILVEKEKFGKIQQILMIASFCYSIVSGFPMGLSYFFGRYKSNTSRINLLKKVFLSLLLVCFGISLTVYLFKDSLSFSFKNTAINTNILLFISLLFFKSLGSYFINFFVLIKKEQKLLFINSLIFLLNISLIVFVFIFQEFSTITSILLILTVIEAIRLVYYLTFIRKYIILGNNVLINKQELIYIISVTGITILNTFYVFIDKYMISFMLTPEDYADYQVGAFVVPFIGIITGSIMTTLIPVFSKLKYDNKLKEIAHKLKNATRYTSIILLPIFTFCLVFGKELITAIYSDRYYFSGEIFQIYTLRYFTTVILFSLTMSAIGLQNWVLFTSLISLVVNVVLNYFLILKFGVIGAVYATVITGYVGVILPLYLINKTLKCKFLDYFPLKEYVFILIISFLIASPIYYFVFIKNDFPAVAVFPISFAFYITILLLTNRVFKIFSYIEIKNKVQFFLDGRRK